MTLWCERKLQGGTEFRPRGREDEQRCLRTALGEILH
jgi:hypothetical protein